MANNITEAQVREIVSRVVAEYNKPTPAPAAKEWDATQYHGRKLIGVFATMEEAIEAANAGYKAVRAMSVAEREKIVTATFAVSSNEMIVLKIPVCVYTMVINDEAELNSFPAVATANNGGGSYILGNDIVCTGTYTGGLTVEFNGTFDGCGYTIYNMTTSNADNNARGLFGISATGTLKNVAFINASHAGQGGFITSFSAPKIENVYIQIDVTPNSNSWSGATSVLVSDALGGFQAKKVFIEYINPLPAGATTGHATYCVHTAWGSLDGGLYVIGDDKVCQIWGEQGSNPVYGTYATRDAFLAANVDVSGWENDFWTIVDGIPCPVNLSNKD